jgi:hypothetical protein
MADKRSSGVGCGEKAQNVGAGSGIRSSSEAQRRLSPRAVVVGGKAIVRLLLGDIRGERGHLTVGWVTIAVDCGGIKAGSTT